MSDSVRIDKWLWAVRVFKTRALATEACKAGHVKIDGRAVKPARSVRVGEIIVAYNGHVSRTIKVLAGLDKRVGAKAVGVYMEDQTAPEEFQKRAEPNFKPVRLVRRGKFSKKDRRNLTQFKNQL